MSALCNERAMMLSVVEVYRPTK